MTTHGIELPPLPLSRCGYYTGSDVLEYARAAIEADRKRRGEPVRVPNDADILGTWHSFAGDPCEKYPLVDSDKISFARALLDRYGQPAQPARPTDDELWDKTLRDRDHYHDMADKLAEAIAEHFGVDIGEHSNMNCPWQTALEVIGTAAQPAASVEPVAWLSKCIRGSDSGKCVIAKEGKPTINTTYWSQPFPVYTAPVAAQPSVPDPLKYGGKWQDHYVTGWNDCRAAMLADEQAQHDTPAQPAPILYQHTDGRYGLSLHGQPAAFTEGDPGWYRVPIDIVEPASGN